MCNNNKTAMEGRTGCGICSLSENVHAGVFEMIGRDGNEIRATKISFVAVKNESTNYW